MNRPIAGPVLLLLALTACGRPADEPDSARVLPWERGFTFEHLETDLVAPDFTVVEGDWRAQPDPETGKNVLAQLAANAGPVFNVILANDTEVLDVDLSTRVYALSGEVDRGGGLVWRAQNGRNYYVCRWNPLESNFRVYKVIDGNRIQLASAGATAVRGWHTMRATMIGKRIECFLDGEKLLTADDGDLPLPGRIGLWTKADAVTLFSELTLKGH